MSLSDLFNFDFGSGFAPDYGTAYLDFDPGLVDAYTMPGMGSWGDVYSFEGDPYSLGGYATSAADLQNYGEGYMPPGAPSPSYSWQDSQAAYNQFRQGEMGNPNYNPTQSSIPQMVLADWNVPGAKGDFANALRNLLGSGNSGSSDDTGDGGSQRGPAVISASKFDSPQATTIPRQPVGNVPMPSMPAPAAEPAPFRPMAMAMDAVSSGGESRRAPRVSMSEDDVFPSTRRRLQEDASRSGLTGLARLLA